MTCAVGIDRIHTKASHVKEESKHRSSKPRSNFTGAEVEVLLQDVDVSILFHYGYINAIELSAYLFIHLHLQCSCTFTLSFSRHFCPKRRTRESTVKRRAIET